MISLPISGAYVAELAPADKRGLYMGAYGLVWAVAFVFGPSLGLLLFSTSPAGLWSACGALGLLAAATILVEQREQKMEDRRQTTEPRAFQLSS
jgi:MFS family permease